jgi:plastocyanin
MRTTVRWVNVKRLLAALLVLLACSAAPAAAETRTETFRVGPVKVGGYEVKVDELRIGIPKPAVDGAITRMDVDLVDAKGAVPIQRLMLHHIVFLKLGGRESTCSSFTAFDDKRTLPGVAERFFAAGEERAEMQLPSGYGYPYKAADTWALTAMIMNHRAVPDSAYVQYSITYETEPVQPVKPIWLDVENCRADPVYDVPGGSTKDHEKTSTWTAPEAGRMVAGGGHVHGGARALRLSQPNCGDRALFDSRPLWGSKDHPFYNVRPVLHEPGPVSMTGTLTKAGFPLAAGEQVKLTSIYDGSRAHTRVMGIFITYFAPDAAVTGTCSPLPTDVVTAHQHAQPGRTAVPKVTVPLTGLDSRGQARTIAKPPGRTVKSGKRTTVTLGDRFFSKPNLLLPKGAQVKWRATGDELHNVTLASGPLGFSSPQLDGGRSYTTTLTRKGTYRLFCALHPVDMTQRIVVR